LIADIGTLMDNQISVTYSVWILNERKHQETLND